MILLLILIITGCHTIEIVERIYDDVTITRGLVVAGRQYAYVSNPEGENAHDIVGVWMRENGAINIFLTTLAY